MTKWLIGGAVGAGVVAGVCHFGAPGPGPCAAVPGVAGAAVEPAPAPAPAPADLPPPARVIEVTDIDAFLDPPPIPVLEPSPPGPVLTAVGFQVPAADRVQPAGAVVPIPPAADD